MLKEYKNRTEILLRNWTKENNISFEDFSKFGFCIVSNLVDQYKETFYYKDKIILETEINLNRCLMIEDKLLKEYEE